MRFSYNSRGCRLSPQTPVHKPTGLERKAAPPSTLEGFVNMAERKLSKSEVKFEHPAKMPEHNCGKCVHWEPPIACAIVQGVVRKEDWCDRWKAKKK